MTDQEKKELQSRVDAFSKEYQDLLDKHNLQLKIEIDFPEYRKLPDEVQLSILVINKHKPEFTLSYGNKPKEEPKK